MIRMLISILLFLCFSPLSMAASEGRHTEGSMPDSMEVALDPKADVDVIVMLQEPPLFPQLTTAKKSSPNRKNLAEIMTETRERIDATQDSFVYAATLLGLVKKEQKRFNKLVNAVVIHTTRHNIDELRKISGVQSVHEDKPVRALLDDSIQLIGADQLWNLRDAEGNPVTGTGMVVAIIDTGVDYLHPDLGGCFGNGCKVIGGWDFVNDDPDPMDDNAHGTHVAGIVAANGAMRGVAPAASLLAYKVLDANGSGTLADIIAAIEAAVDPDGDPLTDDSADVMNLSLGRTEGSPDDPDSVALDNAVAQGVIAVVAAGNSGADHYTIGSPATSEKAITVASSTKADHISEFSSRGPLDDASYQFVKPEITAPGSNINSTFPGGTYQSIDGTSMAAPHVAGGAALLRQLYPSYSPEQIKNLLIHTSIPLDADIYAQGGGRMHLPRAAANAVVTADIAIVHFGRVDNTVGEWVSPNKTIVFTNHGSSPVTLNFAIDVGNTPLGVIWGHSSSLTLAPGESKTTQQYVIVDNALVPFPDTPTQAYESALLVAGDGVDLRIPIVFHKNALLSIKVENPGFAQGWGLLFRDDGTIRKHFSIDSAPVSGIELLLPPGNYHGVFAFTSSGAYIIKENIVAPAEGAYISVSSEDAVHAVRLPAYYRLDGSTIPYSELGMNQKRLIIEHTASGGLFRELTRFSMLPEIYRFNNVSTNFTIKGMALLEDKTAPNDDRQLYHSSFGYQGMSPFHDLSLGESKEPLRIHYGAPAVTQGVIPFMHYASIDPELDLSASGIPLFDNPVFTAPFALTVHMRPVVNAVDQNPMRYPWVGYMNRNYEELAATSIFRPWVDNLYDRGFYFMERGPNAEASFEAPLTSITRHKPLFAENRLGETGLFWNAQFTYQAMTTSARIELPEKREMIYLGAFRDAFHNKMLEADIPFEMYVDGNLSTTGILNGNEFYPYSDIFGTIFPGDYSRVEFRAETTFTLRGHPGISKVHATSRTADTGTPYIRTLRLLDKNNQPTDHVYSEKYDEYRIELDVGDDRELRSVELNLDTGLGFSPLALTQVNGVYVAYLPQLPGGYALAKLEVILWDADRGLLGNSLENEIAPAFVIDP